MTKGMPKGLPDHTEVCEKCGGTEGVRWVTVVTAWYSFSGYLCIQCEALGEKTR